MSFIIS